MLKWTTVHPRKRKDPICTADIQDGFFSVSVAIYYKPSWFVTDENDQPYHLEVDGRKRDWHYSSLNWAMEDAEDRIKWYLGDLKKSLEQKIAVYLSTIEKIDIWQKKCAEERSR